MTARLTEADRTRICVLYKERRENLVTTGEAEKRWQTIGHVAEQVGRSTHTVHRVLVSAKSIPAPRPRGIEDAEMEAIAADYNSGMSLSECTTFYERKPGTVRAVLAYKSVGLREAGGGWRRS
jgi:hypothetical protein